MSEFIIVWGNRLIWSLIIVGTAGLCGLTGYGVLQIAGVLG